MALNYYPYQQMGYPYQQFQQPSYQQAYQQPMNVQPNYQQSQQTQQIQNGGFVSVHNESEARNYPIAPGNSVTFKDENSPYVYTKTQGFSQLDKPVFEKYRLVKEEDFQSQQMAQNVAIDENTQQINYTNFAKKDEIAALWSTIETLKSKLSDLERINKKIEKVEVENDG